MKKLILLFSAIFISALAAMAQTTVRGEVISAEDGEPLIGATVMGVGTQIGVSTDVDGKFSLELPESVKKIRVSYVGTDPVEIAVTNQYLKVPLREMTTLNEVVVTGYGQTSKVAFTGAASVVDGSSIEKKNDVNFLKGMEGNVTGFTYNNSTSSPGTWGSVSIRGLGSLSSSSQPLYVIDGIPVNSDAESLDSDSNNAFDPMAAYNPNDIESVTVLKDAAATAIYGSRAANGVVVITTKRGSTDRMSLTLDVKQGFTSIANNNMKYADAASTMDLFTRGYMARTGADYQTGWNWVNGIMGWDGVTNTDWMNAVTRTGYYQDYNISFSGRSGKTNYYASLGFIDTKGVVINSANSRYSGRVNVDSSYGWLSGGVNASFSYTKNSNFSQSTTGSMSNPIVGAVSSMTPMDPVYNPDGSYYGAGYLYNPLAVNDSKLGDLNDVRNQTFVANPWLKIDLPFGFWVKTNFGVNIVNQNEYNYWSAIYNPQGIDYNGLGQLYTTRASTLTWTNTIGWNKTFNDIHTFDVLLGQEMQRYDYNYSYFARADFPFADEGMRDLATTGSSLDSEYGKSASRLASYFVDAKYNLMNRYFFSASYRRDGSSVFGSNHRWGNFWSVGGKWRISEEDWMRNITWLTNAALRISYGTVGNQALPSFYVARGYYAAGYNYNGAAGMRPVQVASPDLTWETSRKFDVGFDFGIFNRANLTFDFYNDDTADALYEVPLSRTTGMSSAWRNIGKIRNTGIEVGLSGVVFTNRDLTVSLFANLSWNKNRVLKLDGGSVTNNLQILEEGSPYRQFYMREFAGVNQETGLAQYYTADGGLTENYEEAELRRVGQADPKVFGAFGINAQGYGFDFSMQFNYRAGNKVFNYGAPFTGFGMNLMTPLQTVVDNSWTPGMTDAQYPQYIYGDPYNSVSNNYSTLYLMDGSFLRLSNISLGYTLPQSVTRKALMEKVRFYVNLDNVHTWTAKNFVGYNPETYANGVIAWQYPAAFTFTGGVQITF